MDSDFNENNHYGAAEDDDHVFGKHMGDDSLLHSEHVAHHDVPACNGKPVDVNVKSRVINFTNMKCCRQVVPHLPRASSYLKVTASLMTGLRGFLFGMSGSSGLDKDIIGLFTL